MATKHFLDYPVYKEEEALFRRGVKATNSSVQASTAFLNTWTDTAKATKVAMDMVASGVDILAINADEAGLTALKAVTRKPGVYAIGWAKDQYQLAPGKVLTSSTARYLSSSLFSIFKSIR